EDQMCAAWIAAGLVDEGYVAHDPSTAELIRRWKPARTTDFLNSESVAYLLRSNQVRDLDFILSHFDDVNSAFRITEDQIVEIRGQTGEFPFSCTAENGNSPV